MINGLLQEDRLALWDRLIHGDAVEQAEIDQMVTKLAHDASPEERAACVLLLAVAKIAREGSRAMRRNLTAALRYWFSYSGTKNRPPGLNICNDKRRSRWRDAGLIDFMGLYISWSEAMCSVRGNPKDYSAFNKVKNELEKKYVEEWKRVFGSPAPFTLTHGR